jgi:hypothetical protein
MKTILAILAGVFVATACYAAQPKTIAFRNVSTANTTNYFRSIFANVSSNGRLLGTYATSTQSYTSNNNALATCAVLTGKTQPSGSFNITDMTTYAITTKAGVSSTITLSAGNEYKISCYETNNPLTAHTVKMFFDSSETYSLPLSTFFYYQQ